MESNRSLMPLAVVSSRQISDFNWQPKVKELSLVNYTGIDIVPFLISQLSRKYTGVNNFRFAHWDMVKDELPKNSFDIIMARDMIQHNTLEDGLKIFKNIEQSGAKYLLTNFHSNGTNHNVQPGGYYLINPFLPPFNLPKPLLYIREGTEADKKYHSELKYMALWRLNGTGSLLGQGEGVPLSPVPASEKAIIEYNSGHAVTTYADETLQYPSEMAIKTLRHEFEISDSISSRQRLFKGAHDNDDPKPIPEETIEYTVNTRKLISYAIERLGIKSILDSSVGGKSIFLSRF